MIAARGIVSFLLIGLGVIVACEARRHDLDNKIAVLEQQKQDLLVRNSELRQILKDPSDIQVTDFADIITKPWAPGTLVRCKDCARGPQAIVPLFTRLCAIGAGGSLAFYDGKQWRCEGPAKGGR